ncbi:MAG: hypothetical protein ACR2RL_01030 [Gammaproteobacteria bacterium]
MKTTATCSVLIALALLSTSATAQPPVCKKAGVKQPCVRSGDLHFGIVTSGKVRNNTLRSIDLRDGEAVGGIDVVDDSLTSDDLATDSVGSSEIQMDAVGQREIQADGVGRVQIQSNAVAAEELAPNSVSSADIIDGQVTGADIGAGAVTGIHIQDGSFEAADIRNGAGADHASKDGEFNLDDVDSVLVEVAMVAPSDGKVIVNASGSFEFNESKKSDKARCSITTGSTIDFTNWFIAQDYASVPVNRLPFAATRGFDVVANTGYAFRLVCDEDRGIGSDITVQDPNITAMFFPSTY